MDRRFFIPLFAVIVACFAFFVKPNPTKKEPQPAVVSAPLKCAAPSQNQIRLLCIKHSRESMADGDADMAIAAAKKAADKGLDIKIVGNSFVDGRAVSFSIIEDMATFSAYLEERITEQAKTGDTLILFTIGHGFQNGSLHNIGKRSEIMKVIAEAAERHRQKIVWWQLSCYACAGLPSIDSLPASQQEYLSIYATSSASETSAAYVQGRIMEKVFVALADKSTSLDKDGNGRITASELSSFLGTNRFFAKSQEWNVFGRPWIPFFPVVDRNGQQGNYQEEYILMPN
jgi:hypothetical protein